VVLNSGGNKFREVIVRFMEVIVRFSEVIVQQKCNVCCSKRMCLYKRSGMDDWPTERESMPMGVRRLSNRLGQFENFCS
jgi:hypothetical protein